MQCDMALHWQLDRRERILLLERLLLEEQGNEKVGLEKAHHFAVK
jgi:hypothetical protein